MSKLTYYSLERLDCSCGGWAFGKCNRCGKSAML